MRRLREKICKVCKVSKPLDDFPINGGNGKYRRPDCKECHSRASTYKQDQREKWPWKYATCACCGYIWAKIRVSRTGNDFYRNNCPGCGTELPEGEKVYGQEEGSI